MKEEYEIRDMLYQFQKEITYYSQMEALAISQYEKNYNQALIKERTEEIIKALEKTLQATQLPLETTPVNPPEIPPETPATIPSETPAQIPQTPQTPPQTSPQTPSTPPPTPPEQRIFTGEELETYNGKNGNPPYVAISGTVYDLSGKMVWTGGTHFGMMAGHDLTMNFMGCHNGMVKMLQQLPVVGVLIEST